MNIFLRVLNYLAFYLIWYLCLRSIGGEGIGLTLVVAALYFAIHFFFVSERPVREAFFMTCLTLFGMVNETLLAVTGVVTYADAYYGGVAWWTILLWFCFASTYQHAFSWLEPLVWQSSLLGAIVAPICYAVLAKAGAISFGETFWSSLFWIGLDWAIIMPLTFAFSRQLLHRPPPPPPF